MSSIFGCSGPPLPPLSAMSAIADPPLFSAVINILPDLSSVRNSNFTVKTKLNITLVNFFFLSIFKFFVAVLVGINYKQMPPPPSPLSVICSICLTPLLPFSVIVSIFQPNLPPFVADIICERFLRMFDESVIGHTTKLSLYEVKTFL